MKSSLSKTDLKAFFGEKKKHRTRCFQFKIRPSGQSCARVAFSFSRKVGSAVLRNRFKRRIRELIRASDLGGVDFLFTAIKPLREITDVIWQKERDDIRKICQAHKPSDPLAS